MADLRWTQEAEISLKEIYAYIARDRPTTARRTIESLLNRVETLLDYPELGQPYPYLDDENVRVLTYGQFQIAYLAEPGEPLYVLGLFHGLIFLPLT